MAITTIDGAISGFKPLAFFNKALSGTLVAGRQHSFWPVAGIPSAGDYDATLNGAVLSSSSSVPAGAIPHTDPSGDLAYLGRFVGSATQTSILMLVDRLWQNQLTINSTGAQSITSPTWPARDDNGTTDGTGVLLAVEVSAATSGTAAALTATYTNEAGTGSRTANFAGIVPTSTAGAIGAWFPIGLMSGDRGVRSVQTIQFSTAWTSGTINLVAYRILAMLQLAGPLVPDAIDPITGCLPRLYDGVVPFMVLVPSATTSTSIVGAVTETHG